MAKWEQWVPGFLFKKVLIYIFRGSHQRSSLKKVFIKRKTCNFIKKRFQHRCFPVKFAKTLRTPFLKNICERLLLCFLKLTLYSVIIPEIPLFKRILFLVHINPWCLKYNATHCLLHYIFNKVKYPAHSQIEKNCFHWELFEMFLGFPFFRDYK